MLSFYGQFRRKPIGRWHIQACRNVSCSLLGAERILDHLTKKLGIAPGQTTADGRFTLSTVECLASCGTAPVRDGQRHVSREHDARRRSTRCSRRCPDMANTKLLMTFPVTATSHTLAEYRARGGYALAREGAAADDAAAGDRARSPRPASRAAAAPPFPMGRKWGVVHPNDGQPHYLCANADEGEPGTFKDRWILEYAPHLLLESMLIAAYALQVRNAFVYIRGEFDLPYRRLAGALEEAYEAGYFGEGILGTDFACDLVIYRGAGSYVCGEASALITSIEGKRGYPRNRPPRLTVRGLYQKPTVINNVETLSNIAWIIAHGGEAFKKIGTAKDPGTRLISISGHIERPGVYEIEIGYPFAKFIYEDCGGVLGGRALKGIIPGGISTKVLTGEGDRAAHARQSVARSARALRWARAA